MRITGMPDGIEKLLYYKKFNLINDKKKEYNLIRLEL